MTRVIRILGPTPCEFEVDNSSGYVGARVTLPGGFALSVVLTPSDAKRIGRAQLLAAAGEDLAGGADLDHGDEMGPDDPAWTPDPTTDPGREPLA